MIFQYIDLQSILLNKKKFTLQQLDFIKSKNINKLNILRSKNLSHNLPINIELMIKKIEVKNKFINKLVGQSAGIGTNAINNIAALNNQRINYNAKNRSEKTSRYSTLINQMMMLRQLQKGMPISFGATTATATQ